MKLCATWCIPGDGEPGIFQGAPASAWFSPRHGQIYPEVRVWNGGLSYRLWLTTVRFAHPAQQIALQDYIHAFQEAEARSSDYIADLAAAAKLVDGPARRRSASEAGDHAGSRSKRASCRTGRLSSLRQYTTAHGVTRAGSSGTSVRRSEITKAGNVLARRVPIQGAWTYRVPARGEPEAARLHWPNSHRRSSDRSAESSSQASPLWVENTTSSPMVTSGRARRRSGTECSALHRPAENSSLRRSVGPVYTWWFCNP
jgi:hypothetical protein